MSVIFHESQFFSFLLLPEHQQLIKKERKNSKRASLEYFNSSIGKRRDVKGDYIIFV
jgi:hypothetical protein